MRYRNRKFIIPIILLFMVSTLLAGCTAYNNFSEYFIEASVNTEETVRIGVFEPLTGENSKDGELELQGIELAHELYPEVLGKQVELVYADNKSNTDIAESAAQELVDKKVSVVLGSWGSALSLIGGEYFAEARIPAISITATNPLVTSSNEYYFRTCYVESFEGVALAKYAVEQMGYKKAAILRQAEDDYAVAVSQTFTDKFITLTEDEFSIIKVAEYKVEEKDFKKQLNEIKASGAEVVFLPTNKVADTALIMKQAQELGIKTVFLGTHEWESEKLIEAGGDAVEGLVFSTFFDTESSLTENAEVFLNKYREKYGKDAKPEGSAALGFDAYLLAINAIEKANASVYGDAIKLELSKTKDFPGAAGNITFNEIGDPIKPVVIKTITDGKFVYTDTVEPVWQ